jgi:hypothetical protein
MVDHITDMTTAYSRLSLIELAIAAHGGRERWQELNRVRAHLHCGGVIWELKGHAGALDDINVDVDLHRQFASHSPFLSPGMRTAFAADRVAILDADDQVVEERANPRASFAGHVLETPWDPIQLAYFCGYAMWTYLTTPFVFAEPGFRAEELEPWQEGGETWRRLRVHYPEQIATHTGEQTFYIDEKGLIRRHDYTAEIINGGAAAHYSYRHTEVDGIVVPTERRVYPIGPGGSALPEPLLVSINLDNIQFE